MERITAEFVAGAIGSALPGTLSGKSFTEVSTDTRKIPKGCLFIALKGENFNGNDFLSDAFAKGAAACIAERTCGDGPVYLTGNARLAMHALAAAYRRQFPIPVVGVTGSVGKTSTKDMIHAVLSQRFFTHKNEGNRNNEIGMPLSVFGLSHKHTAAVFEMGMSGFGEIERLAKIALPDIGVITNIGISHIEKLGSQENILRAKLEILKGLKTGGRLILNGDDRLLRGVDLPGFERFTYGIENTGCPLTASDIVIDGKGTSFTIRFEGKAYPARLPVSGRHNVYNALAAFACGQKLGLTPEEILRGFLAYEPSGLRQKIEDFNGITLIKDCYNASPDSMHAAFDVLGSLQVTGRRIAVLADMLELGAAGEGAHRKVGEEASRSGVDMLLAFGDEARFYCEGFLSGKSMSCRHFSDKDELAQALADEMRPGDAVLFKGSRGMKLEETIEKACERWNRG